MNSYSPLRRLYAELEEMTRQSYEHLAEADRNRRIAAIEWRVAKLEHLFNKLERQQQIDAANS